MRKLLLALLLSAASFPAGAAVNCPRQPQSERGVLATESLWVKALQTRDANLLGCILAPGFADAAWDGNIWSREQVLASLPGRKPHAIHLSSVKSHVVGDAAVVHGVNRLTGPDGHVIATLGFTDIFKYREGSWRAVSAQEVLSR